MWWIFDKISQIGDVVLYAYSRESRDLDGRISINQNSKEITLVRPCAADFNSAFNQEVAVEKAWRIIALGYPDHRQIACG